jgi:hypothetical protein
MTEAAIEESELNVLMTAAFRSSYHPYESTLTMTGQKAEAAGNPGWRSGLMQPTATLGPSLSQLFDRIYRVVLFVNTGTEYSETGDQLSRRRLLPLVSPEIFCLCELWSYLCRLKGRENDIK